MKAHFIAQTEAGVETYFSPDAGRSVGAPGAGFIADPVKGLAFARERDAQSYANYHLGHLLPIVFVVSKEIPSA